MIATEKKTAGARVPRREDAREMYIPEDDDILFSYLNMKLRDEYASLDELCEEEGTDRDELEGRMARAGYRYDGAVNAFRPA